MPGSRKRREMTELTNLMARFDALVNNCSTEMRYLNDCFLDAGSASDRCKDQRLALSKCQSKMKMDLATINAACGSEHHKYTSCMHTNLGNQVDKCTVPLGQFVDCAEVNKFGLIVS
jgi:hypothetical protein